MTMKSRDVRMLEARSRARHRGVRVEVVRPHREYISRSVSRPGLVHHITRTTNGWVCTCEGYRYTGLCQHLAGVARRSEREGFDLGRIAPLT